jgi:hypothetical protein
MSESAQLIAAGVIFAGFLAVVLVGRRHRPGSGDQRQAIGTGALVPQGDGSAAFVCDLCGAYSQSSRSESLLAKWADQHAARCHPTYVR